MMTYCGAMYYALRSDVAVTTCRHLSIPVKKSIPYLLSISTTVGIDKPVVLNFLKSGRAQFVTDSLQEGFYQGGWLQGLNPPSFQKILKLAFAYCK